MSSGAAAKRDVVESNRVGTAFLCSPEAGQHLGICLSIPLGLVGCQPRRVARGRVPAAALHDNGVPTPGAHVGLVRRWPQLWGRPGHRL